MADALPDSPEDLREQVHKLKAEIARRDAADEAARERTETAAAFAGDVAVAAVAGSDVKEHGRAFWDAWRAFRRAPWETPFPEDETREFVVSLLARLTRVRLVYVLAALIPSAFILAQTVLLWQQNARFDRQNNLLAFEQTTALRELLFIPPYDTLGNIVTNNISLYAYVDTEYIWPQPDRSVVNQIVEFAKREPDIVQSALRPLIIDRAPPVAIGALQILSDTSLVDPGSIIGVAGRFRNADLRDARMNGGVLVAADFSGSNLAGADFSGADLRAANLRGANLYETNFHGADLEGADISESLNAYYAIWDNVDINRVIGHDIILNTPNNSLNDSLQDGIDLLNFLKSELDSIRHDSVFATPQPIYRQSR